MKDKEREGEARQADNRQTETDTVADRQTWADRQVGSRTDR